MPSLINWSVSVLMLDTSLDDEAAALQGSAALICQLKSLEAVSNDRTASIEFSPPLSVSNSNTTNSIFPEFDMVCGKPVGVSPERTAHL